jgi:hypothetical protein
VPVVRLYLRSEEGRRRFAALVVGLREVCLLVVCVGRWRRLGWGS